MSTLENRDQTALLVVDVQNDVVGEAFAVRDGALLSRAEPANT